MLFDNFKNVYIARVSLKDIEIGFILHHWILISLGDWSNDPDAFVAIDEITNPLRKLKNIASFSMAPSLAMEDLKA